MIRHAGCVLVLLYLARSAAADAEVPGYSVLKTHCFSCHADEFQQPGLDMRDRDGLTAPRKEGDSYLVAGKSEQSLIWQVVSEGRMPPADHPSRPDAAEGDALRKWIDAGAEFPKSERAAREFIGDQLAFELVLNDLKQQPAASRAFCRYFSLTHLWNSPLDDEQLQILRSAVSKLVNSLSSEPQVVPVTPVRDDGLLLRIDLRDYGWTAENQWHLLEKSYPFALSTGDDSERQLREITGSDIAIVRADWFVFHASRPPLYHRLLTLPGGDGLPETAPELERLLKVNLRRNIESDRVVRAGVSGENSGPSDHQRIGERHSAQFGYYWVSYDTAGDQQRQNFFTFPLGPIFEGAANIRAFEHDGGELIFSLPNKLQGYLLVKNDGTRIDEGPLNIVRDPNQFSGSSVIVNGISCMGCHRRGIIPFQDAIRALYDNDRSRIGDRVRAIYPPQSQLDDTFGKDREQYERALAEAIRPFAPPAGAGGQSLAEWVEPIQAAARQYGRPLKLPDVARELGLPKNQADADRFGIRATEPELKYAFKFSSELRKLQLQPLLNDESITRAHWEGVYRSAAGELGLGVKLIID